MAISADDPHGVDKATKSQHLASTLKKLDNARRYVRGVVLDGGGVSESPKHPIAHPSIGFGAASVG